MAGDTWKNRRRPYHTCACGETVWFELGGGPFTALIDAEDAPRLGHWNWRADIGNRSVHVMRLAGGKCFLLHRKVIKAPAGIEVDHRDGSGTDNRKRNLRLATTSQNRANLRRLLRWKSTPYKGCSFNKASGKYVAYLANKHLGIFGTAEEAARAYDRAAVERSGEFAATNASLGLLA